MRTRFDSWQSLDRSGPWRSRLSPRPLPGDPAPRTGTFWALLLALGSGPVLNAAFPALGLWPLSFLGMGMILWAIQGRGFWAGTGLGMLAGLGFYLSHVAWTALYLGPIPWLALSTLEAIFFALGCGLIAVAYRLVPRAWPGRSGQLLLPVIIAALWVTREYIAGNWPYGGFAWGRLALAHSESPFAALASWLGVSGLSFIIALIAASAVALLRSGVLATPARLLLPALLVAALGAVPVFAVEQVGTSRIAAVQGNGKAGYFDERDPGDVLSAQIQATLPLQNDAVDMVVWPENGTDLDPMQYPEASGALNYLTALLNAPIITGTIAEREGKFYNSSILWMPETGPETYYDKVRPIPFGEYVPDREFWTPFAPDLINLIGRDYTPGTVDNIFDINGTIAAISICFDIVDDNLLRDAVSRGAQVILAQTNNADFGRTEENQQQLAIARLRAIETGRALVNISTVGTSQMINSDGSTLAEIAPYEPGYMVENVPLHRGNTPAVVLGAALNTGIIIFAVAGVVLMLGLGRRPRR